MRNSLMEPLKKTLMAIAAISAFVLTSSAYAADKGTVELGYVQWSSEIASTNVVRAVLEQQGYKVRTTSLSAAAMWQAVAYGDVDGIVSAWLPTTHEAYLSRVKDKVDVLGANLNGTTLGLVIPAYVKDVNSIADLKAHADEFDNRIVGIDPGAGLMAKTKTAVKEYQLLPQLRLISGSGATMTSELGYAVEHKHPVVVTGWTPHWMFAKWDLKYLNDPKNVFGGKEEIDTVVRKDLKADNPAVYCILDNFHWTPEQMGEVMLMNQKKGTNPVDNARQWVKSHPDVVSQWTQSCNE